MQPPTPPAADLLAPDGVPERVPARESRLERLVYRWSAVGVVGAVVAGLAFLVQESGWQALGHLAWLGAMSVAVLGKFVVFAGVHDEAELGPWSLAAMVWLVDLLIAFALASGLSNLERAPLLGAWLRRARARAIRVLEEYPRIERMAFAGVALVVFLPIAATGAVTGSFAARLVGLSRLSGVLGVALGSAGTALAFASLASFLGEKGETLLMSPALAGASALALVVFGWYVYRRVKKLLRR